MSRLERDLRRVIEAHLEKRHPSPKDIVTDATYFEIACALGITVESFVGGNSMMRRMFNDVCRDMRRAQGVPRAA